MDQAQFYSLDYSKSLVSYIFFHIKPHMDSFPVMIVVRYYMQNLPSVNDPPTWMVSPLHKSEACLQAPDLLSLIHAAASKQKPMSLKFS